MEGMRRLRDHKRSFRTRKPMDGHSEVARRSERQHGEEQVLLDHATLRQKQGTQCRQIVITH